MKTNLEFNGLFASMQGDVQFFSINSIPDNAKNIKKSFIAKSEASGHCHAMCGDYELYELPEDRGFCIKVGTDGCTLNHTSFKTLTPEYWDKNQTTEIADHKPSFFKKGLYYIGIQKRKKHFSKVWEKVTD